MDDEHKNGHLGGPLGIAGAGAILTAGAMFVYAGLGAGGASVDPVNGADTGDTIIDRPIGTDVGTIDKPDTAPIKPDIIPPVKPDTDTDTDTDTDKVEPQEVVKPVKPDPQPDPRPNVSPPPPPAPPPPPVETGPGDQIILIVKVKGDPHFAEAVKLYRKDKPGAARAYTAFLEANPEFKGLELVGGSYSGEAKLAYTFPDGQEATMPAVKRVQSKLMAVDGVSYADLDQVVNPAKGK